MTLLQVLVPYCSSDSFTGSRQGSEATAGLHFQVLQSSGSSVIFVQGRTILEAVLDDLESLGAGKASLVLVGQGSAARGVANACDSLAQGRGERLSCVLDGGELVPWWLHGEGEGCQKREETRRVQEQELWGQTGCQEEPREGRCALLSQHWASIQAPLLVLGPQLDVQQYTGRTCPLPLDSEDLSLAWRGGVVALAEARLLQDHPSLALFLPNCAQAPLLGDWQVATPLVGGEGEVASLASVVQSWLEGTSLQAVDPVAEENSSCGSSARSAPLIRGSAAYSYPSYSYSRYSPSLRPPTSLFPSSYSRSCSLDPYWPSCSSGRTISRVHPRVSHVQSVPATSHVLTLPASSHVHSLPATSIATSIAVPVATSVVTSVDTPARRQRLWRKIKMLRHLKALYNKYKTEYTREYHGLDRRVVVATPVHTQVVARTPVVRNPVLRRPVLRRPSVVQTPVLRRPAVVQTPVLEPDYDYGLGDYDYADYDYGDYDYYDYYDAPGVGRGGGCRGGCGGAGGCAGGCGEVLPPAGGCTGGCGGANGDRNGNLFARIVKAARQQGQKKNGGNRRGGLLKNLVELLAKTEQGVVTDYEDFGQLEEKVLSLEREKRREKKN